MAGSAFNSNLRLHQNEMPHDIPARLRALMSAKLDDLQFHRYPEPFGESLAAGLASWYGCAPDEIIAGPGSSALIRLLLTYYGLSQRRPIVIARPTFAYYEQFCRSFEIPYRTWELGPRFEYQPSELEDLPVGSVVFFASPNNPTGNALPHHQLRALLERHSAALFVTDEAYAEFAGRSALPLLKRHSNLIVLRTLSKVAGVAGLRCGALIGAASRVAELARLQTPWQLSAFTIAAGQAVLEYAQTTNWVQERVEEVAAGREQLFQRCANGQYSFTVFPSETNFLLFKAHGPGAHAALQSACRRRNILVQDLSGNARLENCTRVTIGAAKDTNFFYKAFQEALFML